MANIENKNHSNVKGKYYVDDQCIDCGLCRGISDDCFGYDEDNGESCVIKQPSTDSEIASCEEAKDSCPVGAIGNDGEA